MKRRRLLIEVRRRRLLEGSLPIDWLQGEVVVLEGNLLLVEMVKGRSLQMITSITPPIDLVGCVKMWVRLEARMFAPIVWARVVDRCGILSMC